jgi:FkbM family methyltransferase
MSITSTKKYIAKYDDFHYLTSDIVFYESINSGNSEPYPKHLDIVKKYVKMFPHKNRTYIDVGSHIGSTIIPYSRIFETVVGFEPQSENYQFAKYNIRLNSIKNAIVYPYGLFHKACKGEMIMHNGNNSGCYYFSPNNDKETGETECKRLDDVCSDIINVDFMKIDVHGSELFVLEGARELLLKWKPFIQIETNEHSKNIYGIEKQTTLDFLFHLGYQYFDNDGLNPFFYFPNISLSISPKTIYTFWNGSSPLSESRITNLNLLQNISQCNVHFILEKDISEYILTTEPLHPAFTYLSATHKADYLRTYFLHFYGGGYSDIKNPTGSWIEMFEEIENSGEEEEILGCGYTEIGEYGVAHSDYKTEWQKLIGNGAYIFKPNTTFTKEWYSTMLHLLDTKIVVLREYFLACYGNIHPQASSEDGYPIGWNEMLGQIFHPLVYKYHTRILHTLPCPEFTNYR